MNTTDNTPKFKDKNTQLLLWLPNEMSESIEEILQKLAKHNVKVTKSAFIRRAIGDKLYNLGSFFALLEIADAKGGIEFK